MKSAARNILTFLLVLFAGAVFSQGAMATTVAFSVTSSSGSEGSTPANLAVALSGASGSTITVDYAVTGGTASGGGVDYTLGASTLTFNPGDMP